MFYNSFSVLALRAANLKCVSSFGFCFVLKRKQKTLLCKLTWQFNYVVVLVKFRFRDISKAHTVCLATHSCPFADGLQERFTYSKQSKRGVNWQKKYSILQRLRMRSLHRWLVLTCLFEVQAFFQVSFYAAHRVNKSNIIPRWGILFTVLPAGDKSVGEGC